MMPPQWNQMDLYGQRDKQIIYRIERLIDISKIRMQKIQISPSTLLEFTVPTHLKQSFNVSNLTIRPIAINIFPSHQYELTVEPSYFILESFQQQSVSVILHYSQAARNIAHAKLRVYIWELLQEHSSSEIPTKMFQDHEQLNYEDMQIKVKIDEQVKLITNKSQLTHDISTQYFIRRILPSPIQRETQNLGIPPTVQNNLIKFGETLGHVKGIYTFGHEYVAQFETVFQKIMSEEYLTEQQHEDRCQFFQQWHEGTLFTFVIGRLVTYGRNLIVPEMILLDGKPVNRDSDDRRTKQKSSVVKQVLRIVKGQVRQQKQPKIIQREQRSMERKIDEEIEHLAERKQQRVEQEELKSNFKTSARVQWESQQSQFKVKKSLAPLRTNQLLKQSFVVSSNPKGRKKNKSEERQVTNNDSEGQEQYTPQQFDINQLILVQRQAKNYNHSIPVKKPAKQHELQLTRTILNVKCFENYLFILLSDCVIYIDLDEDTFDSKNTIKFQKIDEEDIKMNNPMEFINNQLIFANDSYLYWINLRKKEVDWKYVQRKEIRCLVTIPELSLLVVGGRNFSKLAYLGKNTTRTNIKLYSCAAADKHSHLHTYDLPSNEGGVVEQLSYIQTAPNKNRLLIVFTHNGWLYFFRVKAFDNIEIYSQVDIKDIGIQSIRDLQWNPVCGLCCLEQLEEMHCLKRIKVKCQYQKVQIATETLKIPVGHYKNIRLTGNSKKSDKKNQYYPQENISKDDETGGYILVTLIDKKTVVISNNEGKNIREIPFGVKGLTGALLSENRKWIIAFGRTVVKIKQWIDQ